MTTSPAPGAPVRASARGFVVRSLGALAQLALIGLLGSLLFSVFFLLVGLGIGLLPLLGAGSLLLVGAVYLLYATGWFEYARVEGLYGYGLAMLPPRRRERPGFGGWLRTLWRQFTDGPMWRGVASFAISTALGSVALWAVSVLASGVGLIFSPLYADETVRLPWLSLTIGAGWAVTAGIVSIVAAGALLLGLASLDAVLSRAILVPSREAILAAQAQTSNVQRAGAVRASEVERTRIERDLHDGVQPRLVSVGMTLGLAQQKIDSDPEAARALIAEAHTSTKAAITELRQLARGIHASVLDDRGLDAALSALAGRSHVPVSLDVRMDGRCSREAEAAAYFAIAESLTNAAKHSRASECRVVVRLRDEGILWARVEDNGVGGARVLPGGGLDGITNRIVAAGGTVRLDSPVGGPTSLEVSLPCAS